MDYDNLNSLGKYTQSTAYNSISSLKDYCYSSEILKEAICSNGKIVFVNYSCQYGCENGACKKENVSNCTDSDGGINYYIKGTTINSAGNFMWADECMDNITLEEGSCDSVLGVHIYTCPNGCENGACKSESRICTSNFNCSSGQICQNGTCINEGSVCCEKTINSIWCQDFPMSSCDLSGDLRFNYVSCNQTSYCQWGTCIMDNIGTCVNMPRTACEKEGKAWDSRSSNQIEGCKQKTSSCVGNTCTLYENQWLSISDTNVSVEFISANEVKLSFGSEKTYTLSEGDSYLFNFIKTKVTIQDVLFDARDNEISAVIFSYSINNSNNITSCTTTSDCSVGEMCRNNLCVPVECIVDLNCATGQVCKNGLCENTNVLEDIAGFFQRLFGSGAISPDTSEGIDNANSDSSLQQTAGGSASAGAKCSESSAPECEGLNNGDIVEYFNSEHTAKISCKCVGQMTDNKKPVMGLDGLRICSCSTTATIAID